MILIRVTLLDFMLGPEQDLSPDFLLNNATFGTITSTTAADGTETNETTLPVTSQDEGENPDAIYLIWNYRDNLPNLGDRIGMTGIIQNSSVNVSLLENRIKCNLPCYHCQLQFLHQT